MNNLLFLELEERIHRWLEDQEGNSALRIQNRLGTKVIEKTFLELAVVVSIFVSLYGVFNAGLAYGVYQYYCIDNHDLPSVPACSLQAVYSAAEIMVGGAVAAICIWLLFRKKFQLFHNSHEFSWEKTPDPKSD